MTRSCSSGKIGHQRVADAHGSAHSLAMALNAEGKLAPSLYVYRCPECRHWHVTKRAEWFGKPNELAWREAPEALQRWAMPSVDTPHGKALN